LTGSIKICKNTVHIFFKWHNKSRQFTLISPLVVVVIIEHIVVHISEGNNALNHKLETTYIHALA